jgi:hypothetical protein
MSQSLSNILIHIVFSTKDRVPFLRDLNIRHQMHAELGGTSKTLNCPPIFVGGVEDHIHLLARESRTITLGRSIHPGAGGTSPENGFQDRISRVSRTP